MKVRINWGETDKIPERLGHGIEIYCVMNHEQERFLLAFVNEFRWLHGYSDNVQVQILSSESGEFTKRGLNGATVIAEVKKSLVWYISRRRIPSQRMGKHFVTWING